jgi:hypothetical protein
MAQWNKIKIMLDDGTEAEAQSPHYCFCQS